MDFNVQGNVTSLENNISFQNTISNAEMKMSEPENSQKAGRSSDTKEDREKKEASHRHHSREKDKEKDREKERDKNHSHDRHRHHSERRLRLFFNFKKIRISVFKIKNSLYLFFCCY
jgi:ABC-type Zn2+ transport system substrate-binding protein/surface adhesin